MLVPLHPVRDHLVALGKRVERFIRDTITKFNDARTQRRVQRATILKGQRESEERRLRLQQEEIEYEQRNAHLRVKLLDTIPGKAEHLGRQMTYADDLSARKFDGPWMIGFIARIGFVSVASNGELLCEREPVEIVSKSYRTLAELDLQLDISITKINTLIQEVEDAEHAVQEATAN